MNRISVAIIGMILLFWIIIPLNADSQVIIERSKDKVSIRGVAYYIHIVDSAQSVYSIAKAYNVSSETLTKENPAALFGISIGQALKIPIVEEQDISVNEKNNDRYIYHELNQGESVYYLSRKYDIPEEMIIESNPGVNIYDIPVGTEIAIPRKQFKEQPQYFQTNQDDFRLHKIGRGENLSSIARLYDISVRELRRANDRLRFAKVGEYIRIPKGESEQLETDDDIIFSDSLEVDDNRITRLFDGSPIEYTSIENLSGSIEVALMLPLYLDENGVRTYIDSSAFNIRNERIHKKIRRPGDWIYPRSELFIEFYEGVLLAVEEMIGKGLSVELHVFDTSIDIYEVERLIETGQLRDMDLIIGPVYPYNMEKVARYARRYRIPVVSPLSSMDTELLRGNSYLFKVQPSMDIIQEALAERIGDYYNYNLVFVHSDTAWDANLSEDFIGKIYREMRYRLPFDEVRFRKVFFTSRSAYNDTINIIDHAMSKDRPNLVILASDDAAVMSEVIVNVHTLLRNYEIDLIGYPDLRWIESLDPIYYYELELMHYTPNWVDYNMLDVKAFIRRYRDKFKMEPHIRSFAWQSYDIAYYFLSGLAVHGSDFIYNPGMHNPDLLQVDFNFERTGLMNGFENNSLYLIRYTPELKVEFIR